MTGAKRSAPADVCSAGEHGISTVLGVEGGVATYFRG
jgi:hypothetical protein